MPTQCLDNARVSVAGLPAISIRQPWVYAIFHLNKDVENRSWRTHYRGPLLIHAAMAIDPDGVKMIGRRAPSDLDRGKIIGIVDLVDVVATSRSAWRDRRFAWGFVLEHPRLIPPIPCRGMQGLFRPVI